MEISTMANDNLLYNARKTVINGKTADNVALLIHDLRVAFATTDDYDLMDCLVYQAGITESTAWRLVKEKKMPQIGTLEKIARACNLRVTLLAMPSPVRCYVGRGAKQYVSAIASAVLQKCGRPALTYCGRPALTYCRREMTLFAANLMLFESGKFIQVRLLKAPQDKPCRARRGLRR